MIKLMRILVRRYEQFSAFMDLQKAYDSWQEGLMGCSEDYRGW